MSPARVPSALARVALATALGATACAGKGEAGGAARTPELLAETCATRLPPRAPGDPPPGAAPPANASPSSPPPGAAPPRPTPATAFTPARSTLLVHAELPLAGIRQALEAKVPIRVAAERDHDLGVAGRLEYTVDRGPFTVRVERDTLVVESILNGRAQACAKGACYASCAPEARATARVPLHLGADYKLRTSDLRIEITRGCQVRALGGLVTVDVTPMLRNALAAQSRSVQASIDRELPDLRPQAARLWTALAQPLALPLGACVALAPEELTQGPASGTGELALLHFGLLARPEVRVKCAATGAGPAQKPLPPLRDDPALPAAGDVHLAIVLPPDAVPRALEGAEPFELGRGRSRVLKATGDAATGLALTLTGESCGDVLVGLGGAAWTDAQALHPTGAAALPGEAERLTAAGLDPARLAAGLERAALPLPIAVSALETLLPELARGLSDDKVSVAAVVESSKPEAAGLRGAEVIAVALVRGAITIRAK